MRLGTDTSEYGGLIETRETLISYIELVIRCQHERFAYPFLFACFRNLIRAGYKGMVFQIYHLLSWESEKETEMLGFENHASKTLHQKLGAVMLGS